MIPVKSSLMMRKLFPACAAFLIYGQMTLTVIDCGVNPAEQAVLVAAAACIIPMEIFLIKENLID